MYPRAGRSAKRRYLDDGLSRLRDNERLSLRRLVDKFRELGFRFVNVYSFHDVQTNKLSLIDLVYQFLAEPGEKPRLRSWHRDPLSFAFSQSRNMDQELPGYVIDAIGRANDLRVRLSPSLGMEFTLLFGCAWVADSAPIRLILPS